jgi:hypothetical protein
MKTSVPQIIKAALPTHPRGHHWEVVASGKGYIIRLCWYDPPGSGRKRRQRYPRISEAQFTLWLSETEENRRKHITQWVAGHTPELALELGWVRGNAKHPKQLRKQM